MPSTPRADRPAFQLSTSRLGQSLLRLHRTLEHNRSEEENVENLLSSWQKRWSTRRDEISRRLELIETQLEQMGRPTAPAPQLSVVGVPADSDQMTSMGPF